MRKYIVGFLFGILFLNSVVTLVADDPYWYSIFVSSKVRYTSTAKAEFRDTGLYINSASDGTLGMYSDGTTLIDSDTKHGWKIGTPVVYFTNASLDTGTAGSNYDSLLLVVDVTNSTGGTADYDSVWIKILN